MATYTNEERMGHVRTNVELEPGEQCALCRCFKSGKFPFCDGMHRQLPGELGPVIVKAAEPKPTHPPS